MFLLEESQGRGSLVGCRLWGRTESDTTEVTQQQQQQQQQQTAACQASLSMGFPKQEYQKGLLFPPPGDHPNPGIKPTSPALAGGFSTTEPPGKPKDSRSEKKKKSDEMNFSYLFCDTQSSQSMIMWAYADIITPN